MNLRDLTDEELAAAWDLWFDLAQVTNDSDPPFFHGVFQLAADGSLRAPENAKSPPLKG